MTKRTERGSKREPLLNNWAKATRVGKEYSAEKTIIQIIVNWKNDICRKKSGNHNGDRHNQEILLGLRMVQSKELCYLFVDENST